MATQQAIATADLQTIENSLVSINAGLKAIDTSVDTVDSNVRILYDEIGALAKDFQAYVLNERRRWELEHATTKLGNVRQELETTFGHYAEVRRTTTGILQATDLGIIRNGTITSAAEELMLDCPEYWLAPCLVALAAWINDQKDIAEKALKEAIRRDDEKASLLFGLICRRADRRNASLKWIKRYLANQDPEKLGRETIIVLDAYAAGLFVADSENAVAEQLAEWLDLLSSKPGFLEEQSNRWKAALKGKREPIMQKEYPYLRQYSKTWPILEDVLEGARAHQTIISYFEGVFAQASSEDAVRKQLDDILSSLVTGFDDEELPLRREERLCQLIIDYDGDVTRAQASLNAEKTLLEEEKDFLQLLTDAAMYPDIAHASVSSQKFAIAYSRDWVLNGYNDMVAENRMHIPAEIEINIDTFNDKTANGSDEDRLVSAFDTLVSSEKQAQLDKAVMTAFEQYCQIGGYACLAIGILALIFQAAVGSGLILGLLAIIAGIGLLVRYLSRKKLIETQRAEIESQFEEKREKGKKVLKATVAEIVDFRSEFETEDSKSTQVVDFIGQLSSNEYVKTSVGPTRKVMAMR